MEEALQRITGHTKAKIHEDFQRDFYLSSSEAVQYGIIDQVLLPREKTRQELYRYNDVSFWRRPFACHEFGKLALLWICFGDMLSRDTCYQPTFSFVSSRLVLRRNRMFGCSR